MLPELIDAGHPGLDLLNTAGGATRDRDVERLGTWADAVGFAERAGLVDAAEATALLATEPDAVEQALRRLRAQREALHRFLLAAATGGEPAQRDRARVERDLVAALRAASLSADLERGPAWTLEVADVGLALIGHRFALATGALLAGPRRAQVSVCGRCSWLFLDTSPSRRRRWCSMETCGNRAKAARHHERGAQTGSSGAGSPSASAIRGGIGRLPEKSAATTT